MEKEKYSDMKPAYLSFLSGEPGYTNAAAPSILVVAAHADDEIIGLGAQISRLKNICFVHTTDGAPENMKDALFYGFNSRESYARRRYEEFCDALLLAGIKMPSYIGLSYTDQKSSFHLADMTRDLVDVISSLEPEVCLVHPYEGGHPDHDSAAFAVHTACRILSENGKQTPVLFEFCSYHSDRGRMATFNFLPAQNCPKSISVLSREKQQLKKKMFACFDTQKNTLKDFPVEIELFREAPSYRFLEEPHPGKLYYENFDWGMTGTLWRSLAQKALDELKEF